MIIRKSRMQNALLRVYSLRHWLDHTVHKALEHLLQAKQLAALKVLEISVHSLIYFSVVEFLPILLPRLFRAEFQLSMIAAKKLLVVTYQLFLFFCERWMDLRIYFIYHGVRKTPTLQRNAAREQVVFCEVSELCAAVKNLTPSSLQTEDT